jgi:hypothetical protein
VDFFGALEKYFIIQNSIFYSALTLLLVLCPLVHYLNNNKKTTELTILRISRNWKG